MKKILLFVFLLLILFVAYLVYNALNFESKQIEVEPISMVKVSDRAKDHMVEAISIRTVSFEDEEDFDSTQFQKFNDFLLNTYPNLFASTEHQTFNEYSHLFEWEGSDPSLKPIIIMGHHDVVPIASPAIWRVHPFTEGIKQDSIYGRGCIDDKGAVISILESVEQLMSEGFQPKRTIYLAFGHDEEVSGHRGAEVISNHLEKKGIEAEFVLDEGGAVTQGLVPGVVEATAVIGIAEKGYVSYELSTNMMGGHSSQPAKETSIDVLAGAISALKRNPLPAKITPVLESFMEAAGPHMDFMGKLAFSNRSVFNSILLTEYEKTKQGNASIRTTTSPTIFEAGIKENVIPTASRAVVNFRILPGETIGTVREHIVTTINDDRIEVEIKGNGFDPSPISPTDSYAYATVCQSLKQIYPDVIATPNLVIGATDARYYASLSQNVYRFTPFFLTPKNINCFHGVDERISVEEFENAIRFYRQVIVNSCGG